jgi:hypothetical protein
MLSKVAMKPRKRAGLVRFHSLVVLAAVVFSGAAHLGEHHPRDAVASVCGSPSPSIEVLCWFDESAREMTDELPPGRYVSTDGLQFFLAQRDDGFQSACGRCEVQAYPYCVGSCPPPEPGKILIGCTGFAYPPGDIGWCYCLYIDDPGPGGAFRHPVRSLSALACQVLVVEDPDAILAIQGANARFPVEFIVPHREH